MSKSRSRHHAGRRLVCESLERRQLMAADFHFGHNFRMPEDTDASGSVSPIDALRVINNLNSRVASSSDSIDVNADNDLTPIDALVVINYLNANTARSGTITVPSNVPSASRIARIQAALESNTLPDGVGASEAREILSTLEAGACPELNETATEGLLATGEENSNTNNSNTSQDTLDRRLAMLSERLLGLGVSQDTVDQLLENVQTAIDEGATHLRTVIQEEMDELGIDIEQLTTIARANRQVEFVTDRLTELEVAQETIDLVVAEMQAAINAGTPLTREQLETKLTELGIDPTEVFEENCPGPRDLLNQAVDADQVEAQLTARGVSQEIINTILGEIQAAEEAGDPMTRRELVARLVELNVLGQADPPPVRRIIEQFRRRFR